jgi:fido (protein-threonine AMPylation protein)
VTFLDEQLTSGKGLDSAAAEMVLQLMSWTPNEWVRIHPFANGNGRIARIWANWVAMRYGLPPFVRPRPHPAGDAYANAASAAMTGDQASMVTVFRQMLLEFSTTGGL